MSDARLRDPAAQADLLARVRRLVTDVVKPEDLESATLKKARLVAAMPNEMQRIYKRYINHCYDLQGMQSAQAWHQDLMSMMSVEPVPAYAEFSKVTNEKGLRAALEVGNKPYEGLD